MRKPPSLSPAIVNVDLCPQRRDDPVPARSHARRVRSPIRDERGRALLLDGAPDARAARRRRVIPRPPRAHRYNDLFCSILGEATL